VRIYLFLTLLLCFSSLAQEKIIEVIAIEYPPFTTVDRDDDGLAFNLLRKRNIAQGLLWTPLFFPPKRALRVINANEWCASFYPPPITLDYSTYILDEHPIQLGLIRKKQLHIFAWASLNELKPFNIGLLRSDKHSKFVKLFTDAGINVVFLESVDKGIRMVLADRIDYAILDNITFESLNSALKSKLQLSTTHILEIPISIYINNQCTSVNDSFQ
jgi:polar amino acid transport system substrate-binding protein